MKCEVAEHDEHHAKNKEQRRNVAVMLFSAVKYGERAKPDGCENKNRFGRATGHEAKTNH